VVAGENGQLVDQRFLPRIVEGEVRVMMIRDRPINVVHKRPTNGQLSATLFSGAK
jgi:Prokaryotic glutathione synthetase, ATP-grasp domain